MFDALYEYEFLARPVRLRPNTAAAHARGVGRLQDLHRPRAARHLLQRRPGVQGQEARARRRRLRLLDQAPFRSALEEPDLPADREQQDRSAWTSCARRRSRDKKPFDYDTPVEGLRALDRYTIQFKLGRAEPALRRRAERPGARPARSRARWSSATATRSWSTRSAPARTGSPQWRRSSLIVFEKNPNYRDVVLRRGGAGRRSGRAGGGRASSKGSKLPMVDRVEVSVIEQPQPRWLAVRQPRDGRHRAGARRTSPTSRSRTTRSRRTSPSRASTRCATCATTRRMSYFAMENPVVGGYTPEKVALRRAIALAVDVEERDPRRPARPGDLGAVDHGARALGLRPGVPQRDGRLRPRQGEGAARSLRLRRPRRRRLARPARRHAARARVRDPARRPEPPAHHAVEEEHGRDRRPHRLQDRAVAREPEGLARRQADDVGRRPGAPAPTARASSSSATAPTKGQANHARFDLRRVQPPVPSCQRACPTGPSACR